MAEKEVPNGQYQFFKSTLVGSDEARIVARVTADGVATRNGNARFAAETALHYVRRGSSDD